MGGGGTHAFRWRIVVIEPNEEATSGSMITILYKIVRYLKSTTSLEPASVMIDKQ